ncbi:MAG: hypothetical protein WC697_01185 [Patescibacteria group bacterium]|jgi:hypothetical protein
MDNIYKIKKVFKENFLRELSDKEASDFFNDLLIQSKLELSKIPGFTEEAFQRYFSNELEILFSPKAINKEILRIINIIGIESLENSSKYKRLSEMTDASCLVLALKKLYAEEWMIKAQDNPDILLVKHNADSFNKKPFDAVALEIMQIPERAKKTFSQDIEKDIAEFIRDKKFNKRYGEKPHLLIHFNFNQMGLKLKMISEILYSFPNNPFHQIWIRANTDSTFRIMNISMVYPKFTPVQIDMLKEQHLLF